MAITNFLRSSESSQRAPARSLRDLKLNHTQKAAVATKPPAAPVDRYTPSERPALPSTEIDDMQGRIYAQLHAYLKRTSPELYFQLLVHLDTIFAFEVERLSSRRKVSAQSNADIKRTETEHGPLVAMSERAMKDLDRQQTQDEAPEPPDWIVKHRPYSDHDLPYLRDAIANLCMLPFDARPKSEDHEANMLSRWSELGKHLHFADLSALTEIATAMANDHDGAVQMARERREKLERSNKEFAAKQAAKSKRASARGAK